MPLHSASCGLEIESVWMNFSINHFGVYITILVIYLPFVGSSTLPLQFLEAVFFWMNFLQELDSLPDVCAVPERKHGFFS